MDEPATLARSLNIPKIEPDASYKAYTDHPCVETLNQIMINYLGIEEILKLYSLSHEQFETEQSLSILAIRFQLPTALTFKELLRSYDLKYATVRSYHYNDKLSCSVMFQAAKEGNIQALYNGLKMYPELRMKEIYNKALMHAAINAHRIIIDLLLELGADPGDRYGNIILGASIGGHMDLIREFCVEGHNKGIFPGHDKALEAAAKYGHLHILDYLLKKRNYSIKVLNFAFFEAGEGGRQEIIDYLVSKGATDYFGLLKAAAKAGHLDIVKMYYNKAIHQAQEQPELTFDDAQARHHNAVCNKQHRDDVFSCAATYNHLNIVKFLVETGGVTPEGLQKGLSCATDGELLDIINYLTTLGVVMPSDDASNESD
ncbi:Hypothetical protein POVR1_LOCUS213 [uncultured virus]|nr:Hypothetical protein POVR1_LOCUS213 [uncultured virus]